MVKIIKLLLILSLFSFPLKAENINNIIINGNKRVSDETVKIYGEINNTKTYSEKNANRILKIFTIRNFLKNVEILFENNTLIVNLKEYPTINQLIIGEKSNKFETEIKKIISSKEKNL